MSYKGTEIINNYIRMIGGHNGPCSYDTKTKRCNKKSGKWDLKICELSKKSRCKMNEKYKKQKEKKNIIK